MTILHWSRAIGRNVAYHVMRDTKRGENAVPYHGHDFAEVFWVDGGQGRHRVNGMLKPLNPAQVVFMRPSDCHGIELRYNDFLTITNVAFPLGTLQFLRQRYFPNSTRWFWSKDRLPTVLELEPQALAELTLIADRLALEPRQRFYIERFLINLLYRVEIQESHAYPLRAPDWLRNACRQIQTPEHLRQGVRGFVKLAGRCHEHVSRVSRACLGQSPGTYIKHVRMRYAATQLEMTDRSIMDIAMDCGLQNLSHFYKLFRTFYKISPRRFRIARQRLN